MSADNFSDWVALFDYFESPCWKMVQGLRGSTQISRLDPGIPIWSNPIRRFPGWGGLEESQTHFFAYDDPLNVNFIKLKSQRHTNPTTINCHLRTFSLSTQSTKRIFNCHVHCKTNQLYWNSKRVYRLKEWTQNKHLQPWCKK